MYYLLERRKRTEKAREGANQTKLPTQASVEPLWRAGAEGLLGRIQKYQEDKLEFSMLLALQASELSE